MELIHAHFFIRSAPQPAYRRLASAREAEKRNTISYRISPYGVNLPCGMNMDEEKVEYVCNAVKRVLNSV